MITAALTEYAPLTSNDLHLKFRLSKIHPVAADTIRKWYAKTDVGPPPGQPEATQSAVTNSSNKAERFLSGYLGHREKRSTDVMAKARSLGLHPSTVRRAKDRLNIGVFQRAGEWFWRMP